MSVSSSLADLQLNNCFELLILLLVLFRCCCCCCCHSTHSGCCHNSENWATPSHVPSTSYSPRPVLRFDSSPASIIPSYLPPPFLPGRENKWRTFTSSDSTLAELRTDSSNYWLINALSKVMMCKCTSSCIAMTPTSGSTVTMKVINTDAP